jgi:hypothetical protein
MVKLRVAFSVLMVHIMAFCLLSQWPVMWRSVVASRKAITVMMLESPDETTKSNAPQEMRSGLDRQATPRVEPVISIPNPVVLDMSPRVGGDSQSEPNTGAADMLTPTPLNLQLPKGWAPPSGSRHPALEFNFGQRPATLESRLSKALGDGQWTEERLGDGRLRLRNGNRCIEFQRSRLEELGPSNASPMPWMGKLQAC